MIQYRVGNILDVTEGVIVHQVNCQGVMGSGLAKQIKDKYPVVYDKYLDVTENYYPDYLLGKIQVVNINHNLDIVNLFGQEFYGRTGKRFTSYDALAKAFEDLDKQYLPESHIHLPRIGCGLGGADWKVVEAIINTYFAYSNARKVTVWSPS